MPGGGLVVGLVFVKAFGLPVEIVMLIRGIYPPAGYDEHHAERAKRPVATVIISRL